jgi:hypothetical protein
MELPAAQALQPPTTMVAAGCTPPLDVVACGVYDRMGMPQRIKRVGSIGTAALLLCAAAPLRAATVEPALSARLRRIETAFRGGDAGSLRPAFTANTKVRVDLKDVMEGPGSYGPSQLEVIFGRIFDENRTRQFSFRDEDVTVSGPGIAFARGRWVRRSGRGGAEATDTVTFTLRQESGDWRIHEIRSSR